MVISRVFKNDMYLLSVRIDLVGKFIQLTFGVCDLERCYAPAQEAIRNIQSGLNAQIFTGLCDLFYCAANIIDERAEEIQAPSGEPVISRRQRREEQAKRDGVVMQM